MFTHTGKITNVYTAPVALIDPTAPDGIRTVEQLNLTIKSSSDDREYQHSLPVDEKTVSVKNLEEWQAQGKLVTVFASSVRAITFAHDLRKDEQGNPLKRYMRSGRKAVVTGADGSSVQAELDAMVVFQSYDVRLAEQVKDLDKEADRAAGDFLRQQQERRRLSNATRIERARQQVEERKARIRAEREADVQKQAASLAGTATTATTSSAGGGSRRAATA